MIPTRPPRRSGGRSLPHWPASRRTPRRSRARRPGSSRACSARARSHRSSAAHRTRSQHLRKARRARRAPCWPRSICRYRSSSTRYRRRHARRQLPHQRHARSTPTRSNHHEARQIAPPQHHAARDRSSSAPVSGPTSSDPMAQRIFGVVQRQRTIHLTRRHESARMGAKVYCWIVMLSASSEPSGLVRPFTSTTVPDARRRAARVDDGALVQLHVAVAVRAALDLHVEALEVRDGSARVVARVDRLALEDLLADPEDGLDDCGVRRVGRQGRHGDRRRHRRGGRLGSRE